MKKGSEVQKFKIILSYIEFKTKLGYTIPCYTKEKKKKKTQMAIAFDVILVSCVQRGTC